MYGAPREECKHAFIKELVNVCGDNPYPMLIGGDFNIIRYHQEKNKHRFDKRPLMFNDVIGNLELSKIALFCRQFTSKNIRVDCTYGNFDVFLLHQLEI